MDEAVKDTDKSKAVVCVDYEKIFGCPRRNTNPEYYKRQLTIQNFGVHNLKTGQATLFPYPEHYAKKGANEVASFLVHYLENLPAEVKKVAIYCDNCAGQNKNCTLFGVMQGLVEEGRFELITIHYATVGHSYMACDRDFALIEQKMRRVE